LILSRKYAAVLLATLAGAAAAVFSVRAQPQGQNPVPAQPPSAAASTMNRNLVVLDPAHGGPETGATLSNNALEKNLTLALAQRLRTALTAAGFTVVTTRDADVADALTGDQRAEIANRTHAVACVAIHATAIGSGLHLYTSTLQASVPEESSDAPSGFVPVPWDMAQAGFVAQSLRLADDLSAGLGGANLPVLVGRATVRPLDNLMCPAVALEVAPLLAEDGTATPVTDTDYQKRVVDPVTAALKTWRVHADSAATAEAAPNAQTSSSNPTTSAALRPAQKGSQ
jgi:N-acetylmuramoyl-L-alanine amidase